MSDLRTQRIGDVAFTCPGNWTVEDVPAINGMIALDSIMERNWQANIMFEVVRRERVVPLPAALDRLCETLGETKHGLHVRRRGVAPHPSGSPIACVEYDSMQDGVALTQWDAIWNLDDDGCLFVTAASECSLWPRYEPIFDSVLASICTTRVPSPEPHRTSRRD
jgi:hypothetical protein